MMNFHAPAVSQVVAAKQRRLILIIAILLLVALLLAAASLFVGRSPIGPQLNQLVAEEQETVRINELVDQFDPDLALRQVQANVDALLATDLASLEPERATTSGDKKLPKQATDAALDEAAEDQLQAAARRNNLIATYVTILRLRLQDHHDLAQRLKTQTKRQKLRQALEQAEAHAQNLLEQVDTLAS